MENIKITVEYRGKESAFDFGDDDLRTVLESLKDSLYASNFWFQAQLRDAILRATNLYVGEKAHLRWLVKSLRLPKREGKVKVKSYLKAKKPTTHLRSATERAFLPEPLEGSQHNLNALRKE